MNREVINWEMDGSSHREEVNTLHEELVAAVDDEVPFPIRRIFELLPVKTAQEGDAVARGDIEISGSRLENLSDSQLEMEFTDPAMGKFIVTVPATIAANRRNDPSGDDFILDFVGEDVEFEIPKISELGLRLSDFQNLRSMRFSEGVFTMILRDAASTADDEKFLQIIVLLADRTEGQESRYELRATEAFRSFDVDCGGLPGDDEWFVARANSTRVCVVVKGTPPSIQYPETMASGFGSESEANAWIDSNCDNIGKCP